MAFDPLGTDEKLAQPVKPEKDLDTILLGGCSTFVFICFLVYGLTSVPFYIFSDVYKLSSLIRTLAIGGIPACILGLIFTRRFGAAGFGGFLGGLLTSGVFLHLRLRQVMLSEWMKDAPQPDYPMSFIWIIPTVFVIGNILLALLVVKKNEIYPSDSN